MLVCEPRNTRLERINPLSLFDSIDWRLRSIDRRLPKAWGIVLNFSLEKCELSRRELPGESLETTFYIITDNLRGPGEVNLKCRRTG